MKSTIAFLALICISVSCFASSENVLKQYLRFIYGDSGIDAEKIMYANPDIWMIPGSKNIEAINKINETSFYITDPGVYAETLGRDINYAELYEGKIKPEFTLHTIYTLHKQLFLNFIYAALRHDKRALSGIVTDIDNIDFGDTRRASSGDMGVYLDILATVPVIRSSSPAHDATTHSITYRVPFGQAGFELTLVKEDSYWKIDSDKKVVVPLDFFFK